METIGLFFATVFVASLFALAIAGIVVLVRRSKKRQAERLARRRTNRPKPPTFGYSALSRSRPAARKRSGSYASGGRGSHDSGGFDVGSAVVGGAVVAGLMSGGSHDSGSHDSGSYDSGGDSDFGDFSDF